MESAANIISKVLGISAFLIVVGLVWRLWSRQENKGLNVPSHKDEEREKQGQESGADKSAETLAEVQTPTEGQAPIEIQAQTETSPASSQARSRPNTP